MKKQLFIVGIGPGNTDHLSSRALEVIKNVEVIAGYETYIDLIRPLISNKEIVSTGMKREVQRVEKALEIAQNGRSCAVISSGDPGIYAMAGLVFEMCKNNNIKIFPMNSVPTSRSEIDNEIDMNSEGIYIEVVPGIPALSAGASLLGAPITHDFASISLSDLLTSWELIERRIENAAAADFVIIIYNPKSKKRNWQLEKAQQILLRYRNPQTPVGIVISAMRPEQSIQITTLENLHLAPVNMQTIIFIGNNSTTTYMDFMITPRGYSEKYEL